MARRTARHRRRRSSLHRIAVPVAVFACLVTAVVTAPSKVTGHTPSYRKLARGGGCLTPSAELIGYIDSIIVSSGSTMRNRTHLPAGTVSSVSVVTDSALCRRAAVAMGLSRHVPDSLADTTVSVMRVGPTRYVVTDTGAFVGEYQVHIIFDTAFTLPPLYVLLH
jgi:hypothetical protein